MTSRRPRRKLPPLPPDLDPTSAEIVIPLLEAFVLELGDQYHAPTEGIVFRDLLESELPGAWKAYQDLHWEAHFGKAIDSIHGEITRRAKRETILRAARKKAATSAGVVFEDDGLEDNPIFKLANSIDGKGWHKKIMSRNRIELLTIAERFESSGRSRLLMGAFNRELAKRLTTDEEIVSDRWSPAEVADLFGETFQEVI